MVASNCRTNRILIIAPQPFYSDRGTPMNTLLMSRVLTEAGFKVDLAVLPTGVRIRLKNLSIYRPPRLPGLDRIPIGASWVKLIYDALLAAYAFQLALARRYCLFHGIEEGALIAAVLGRVMNLPVICDMDSNIPEQLSEKRFIQRARLQGWVERSFRWAATHSSLIITVCDSLSEHARRIAPGVPVAQINDIPLSEHGTGAAGDSPLTPDELKALFGLDGSKTALYTGNLESYQGIALMLDAWKWLKCNSPELGEKLVIVGGGASEIANFREQCRSSGIDDSVVWVGQRPAAEMNAWMALADILVSPRILGENTPLKLFTYMASGRAVVATRRPTHTQVIGDHEAYLAEPDPPSLGQALLTAFSDESGRRERARAALEKIRREYNYDIFQSKLIAAYRMAMNR